MWLTLWRKFFLKIFIPFFALIKNRCLTNPNFPQYLPLSNKVKKTYFPNISMLVAVIVNFMFKKKILYEFPPKCFKTTERHSLAGCGSLCGETFFLLIFIPFFGLIKKQLFKQIQIFLSICFFSTR